VTVGIHEREDSIPFNGHFVRLVGRPGLDPGTLGIEPDHPTASDVVKITWSGASVPPATSSEILSNLIPRLHQWLRSRGNDVSGDVKICGSDGLENQVCLDGWSQ
jgi:hypothetical protein